ncbi:MULTISPECIES: hypothetical protein [Variovorax]|jgi:hypothetical protein|uniref:hypothetical protein n=1 Tax=Variovorax TaxID=34072 RepID=UPI000A64C812|nr:MULTISPECIES: hypothetical protein [Variovorax]UKI10791.1 hypothetical protein L3V85_13365 [Variovorax paradoxus]
MCYRTMRGVALATTTLMLLLAVFPASALNAFGFTQAMTPQQVARASTNLGIAKWFGKSLIVQAQDDVDHSYLFNFCNDRLYSASQTFPANFERMAGFIDQTIQQYGQPMFVSAVGGMGSSGFIRPINLYWKLGESDYLRLMQLERTYALVYETKNTCTKVPG